jgi:tetratricopeptide (TPR) repeat protein
VQSNKLSLYFTKTELAESLMAELNLKTLFNEGLDAYSQGDLTHAEQCFKTLLKEKPSSTETLLNLGNIYFKQNQEAQAEQMWLNALEINPTEEKAYLNLGNLYYKQNLPYKAIYYWEVFRLLEPRHPEVNLNLGVVYESLQNVVKSYEYFQKFLLLRPMAKESMQLRKKINHSQGIADNNVKIAEKYLQREEFAKAKDAYDSCILLYPMQAVVYKHYAAVLYKTEQYEKAAQYYEISSKLIPQDVGVMVNMALAYEKANQFFHAISVYTTVLRFGINRYNEKLEPHTRNLLMIHGQGLLENALDRAKQYIREYKINEALDLTKRIRLLAQTMANTLEKEINEVLLQIQFKQDPRLFVGEQAFAKANEATENSDFETALHYYDLYMTVQATGERVKDVLEMKGKLLKILHTQKRLGTFNKAKAIVAEAETSVEESLADLSESGDDLPQDNLALSLP